jgi:hypothetical protein
MPMIPACRVIRQLLDGTLQMKFLQLAVLGANPAHGAGGGAHHHGLGLDHVVAETDSLEHGAGGNAGRGKHAVALHHVFHGVFLAGVLDPHLGRAAALFLGVEHQAALYLPADAGQR